MELFEYDYNKAMEVAIEEAEARGAISTAMMVARRLMKSGFSKEAAATLVSADTISVSDILQRLGD